MVESERFARVKDIIEDSAGEELIQKIKERYPDLDLSFLTDNGVETDEATQKGIEHGAENELASKKGENDRSMDSTVERGSP